MTGIQWTDETWNPTTGCDKVSPGCGLPRFDGDDTGGCYAMAMAKRLKRMGQAKYQADGDPRTSGPGFGVTLHPDVLDRPLHWREPRRIFVNSMSDLFHESVPDAFIAEVFAVMARAHWHTFQVLTKRHGRMRSLLSRPSFRDNLAHLAPWPLPNVWLGVSAEDQKWWDIRWAALRETPAAVRFVSAEPMLGPIDPELDHECGDPPHWTCPVMPDWLIIGGESGPGARPMRLEWVRQLLAQCREPEVYTVPFVKQLGAVLGRELGAGAKGGDIDAFPEDLRVREFPRAVEAVTL
jgi:protein gp37